MSDPIDKNNPVDFSVSTVVGGYVTLIVIERATVQRFELDPDQARWLASALRTHAKSAKDRQLTFADVPKGSAPAGEPADEP